MANNSNSINMQFSKFSNHFNANSGILQLMNDLGEAVNPDVEWQMLGGGNPASIPHMEAIFREEMMHFMNEPREFESMIGNYDSPQGSHRLIDALVNLFNNMFESHVDSRENRSSLINPGNIAITNGSQASFSILFNLFAGEFPGGRKKKILLPMAPEYIGYNDVGLGEDPLFISNKPIIEHQTDDSLFYKYRVDFDSLNISDSIGAICVSRPTNPTGNVITDNELSKLSGIAQKTGIPLILDGAYGLPFPNIIFSDAKPVWNENTILCLSLSKLGLPGVRTGIVVAHEKVIEKLTGANAIYNLSPGRFGPALVTRLVENQELIPLCKKVIKPYYKEKSIHAISLIRQSMNGLPVQVHLSEGAIFLWLWFKDLPISSETLYQRLKKRGVMVISGHHFFPGLIEDWKHMHQCIRVSYAADNIQLEKGIEIIAKEVRRAYHSG